jgi:hypothetical protein
MPINLAGGYAAGGMNDALLDLVKQRMLEQQLEQRAEEERFQRARQMKLDERADEQTRYSRGQDAVTAARQAEQDALARETRTQQNEIGRFNLLKGQPEADIKASLGEDYSTGQTVPTAPNPAIPGNAPTYAIGQNTKANPMMISGVKIRPPSMEDQNKSEAADEERKTQNAIRIAQAKPPNRNVLTGFLGPHDEPVQIDEFGRTYIGTQEVPTSQLHKAPPQPFVIAGPGGPMIVDRRAGTGRAVQEVGPDGQPTGATIGNKLPEAVITKIGDIDSVINNVNEIMALKKDEWLGPIQGRITKGHIELPGFEVPQDLADFAAKTAIIRNATIKATTGMAMGDKEAERIMEQIPELTDKPAVWLANAQATIKNLSDIRAKALALSGAQSNTVGVTGGRGGGPGPGTGTGRGGPAVGSLVGNYFVTDPKGKKHAFQTQAEADAFKAAAGIK